MAFYLFVNGNRVHDEGEHDAAMRVTRDGVGALTFASKAEGEAFADALYQRTVLALPAARRGAALSRESYVVSEKPPPVGP